MPGSCTRFDGQGWASYIPAPCLTPPAFPLLPDGPFARLATLLKDVEPGKAPISLALGDPSGTVPDFVKEALAREAARFGNYPMTAGTQEWREAAAAWVVTRFGLPAGRIDPERHVLPLNGTRDGLFSVLFPFVPQSKAGQSADRGHAQSLLSGLCRRRAWPAAPSRSMSRR